MSKEITIGGERLGNGKKMKAYMHNYERSTHDLSYVWRSTMSAGTLVPFMTEVGLPGDTFDIDLNVDIMTHPTIGPLFGSYKVQLDVFQIPIRLYQAKLHMNMLNIGRDMSKIKLPQVKLYGNKLNPLEDLDNQQVNPSCIFSYLGIRGLGNTRKEDELNTIHRNFNAVPWLGYWDIYKNYYANKQEEIGSVIHKQVSDNPIAAITNCVYQNTYDGDIAIPTAFGSWTKVKPRPTGSTLLVELTLVPPGFDPKSELILTIKTPGANPFENDIPLGLLYDNINYDKNKNQVTCSGLWGIREGEFEIYQISQKPNYAPNVDQAPLIKTFPLENIDKMREDILKWFSDQAFEVNFSNCDEPYKLALDLEYVPAQDSTETSIKYTQEGLALKTYQSDLFNNWISTEWIDGPDGISELTAIDTSGGSFTLDELNLSQKIYNMLNRIALSGGTYDDWLDAVYTHDRQKSAENPIYLGGAIRELVFQEVVSNASTEQQPLGTLAGRGKLTADKKGGKIIAKIDEPSYIMGIISLTPRIDYSQGNKWDMNLKSLNDFHKPALDEIGFQDLITDQMAFFDTESFGNQYMLFKSAGKQPAWLNYMTNVNTCKGNFAIAENQMFMTLNRKYDYEVDDNEVIKISDLTTYIDPSKFNSVFAQTSLDAQNFWAQIGVNITARRKMSAKIIPNL